MGFEPRDYQAADRDKLREAFQQFRSVCYQLETGGGKTGVAAAIAEGLARYGLGMLALVHRRELVDQWCKTLDRVGLSGQYGVIAANRAPSPWAKFQVASIQTIHRRRHLAMNPALVVVDECHHIRAATWESVLGRFKGARLLGLTATPLRLDGKALGTHFEHLVQGPSDEWLTAHGWLAPVSLKYVGRGVLTKKVRRTAGDYNRKDLGEQINRSVVAAPVNAYLQHAPGRRALFFGINTQDSREVAELFVRNGVRAAHIDGNTPDRERDMRVEEFRDGHLDVLCNVDIAGEGTDFPGCDCVLMGIPTLSLVRYRQAAGRARRPDHGRDALFIDLTGNIWRHGPPDMERTWSLNEGYELQKKKPTQARVNMRVCVHCASVYPARRPACPTCGQQQPLETPKHLDVELLTRAGDEPMDKKPVNRMVEVRREIAALARNGASRAAVRELRERYGFNSRWEQNTCNILGV